MSVACLVVEEGDVALLPEAVERAGVVRVGVPVGAAHAGRVRAAQLAELVRVVPERVVPEKIAVCNNVCTFSANFC